MKTSDEYNTIGRCLSLSLAAPPARSTTLSDRLPSSIPFLISLSHEFCSNCSFVLDAHVICTRIWQEANEYTICDTINNSPQKKKPVVLIIAQQTNSLSYSTPRRPSATDWVYVLAPPNQTHVDASSIRLPKDHCVR